MKSFIKTSLFFLTLPTMVLILSDHTYSQNTPGKDTVKISISDQNVIIPMPPSGNRTTIKFENSTENIEVSVFRLNKNAVYTPSVNHAMTSVNDSLVNKKILWLSQLEFGYMALWDKSILTKDLFQGVPFHQGEYIDLSRVRSKRETPYGFFANLTMKEKERKLNGNHVYLITGIKLTFDYLQTTGGYSGFLYQTDTGVIINSTIVSSSFTLRYTSLGLEFPLACRKIYHAESKYPVRLDLGINLVSKVTWRDFSDGFTSSFYGEDDNPAGLLFYPQAFVAISKGALGIFAAADIEPLSFAVNRQNRFQTFTAGLCIRPFHSFSSTH